MQSFTNNRNLDANSEDSLYDFEEETKSMMIKRGERNHYLESNDFKTDPKHGLVYTNEELIKI